ncbi:MAG: 3-phosphoshikimate 1-carboxyvinyltransferase [Mediterranea sp.]|nr:3-phosphoshikimate 1-carboxyvinyltransferase [Mediterranea sp.]
MEQTYTLAAPVTLQCSVDLPASKSISNRALILHALSGGVQRPMNLSDCDDTAVMIRALEQHGAEIDIHAAGTAMRFLTAYLSTQKGSHLLTGSARMKQRPIRLLVDALRALGADIQYADSEGFPPLLIQGKPLPGQEITLAGSVSSQYISALLMIGPTLPQGLTIHLTGQLISVPYINLTLSLMAHYGASARWTDERTIRVEPGPYQDVPFTVESDWSAASYWYEMMALWQLQAESPSPCVELIGLFPRSSQGDSRGAELFAKLGVHTAFTSRGVELSRLGVPVARMVEDLVDIPDLAQTFVVTCCLMGIPFRFSGLQSLRIKETDRITALQQELHKIGYVVKDEADSILSWNGERCPAEEHPVIATYDDHRMALAFAPAILRLPSLAIAHPEVVSKSYPTYWRHLAAAGFSLR